VRWIPASVILPPPSSPYLAMAPGVPGYPTGARRRSWLATSGGIVAIAGAAVITVGCSLPYVHYTGDSSTGPADTSVFNGGFNGAWGDIAEPVMVIVFTLAAAIAIISWTNRVARALAAGALVTIGTQTLMMFVGYDAAGAAYGQLQAGAALGPVGAVVLLAGGILAAASLLCRDPGGGSAGG